MRPLLFRCSLSDNSWQSSGFCVSGLWGSVIPKSPFRSRMMTYLTCTKHRSYQRKHIDVCRQCPDNDGCDAFQAHAAIEPSAPLEPPPTPSESSETDIPIHLFLQEFKDLRALVANTPFLQETEPVQRRKKPLHATKLVDFIKSELEEIRKLC